VKEEKIIRGCKLGKSDAQEALYRRFAPMMLGVCKRYLADAMEAEHVMVGGMVKVYSHIDRYSGEGSFEGWIRKIMVNECLMYLRKNKSLALATDIDDLHDEPSYDATSADIDAAVLMHLIQQLPDGYRAVFNLYAIEGYKHEEIATELGISVGTSKSQLNRARKLLQSKLSTLESETDKKMSYGRKEI
jgi:RNA polymerase sigma-70 factor (ECF subfamily)